jgi:thiol-disulfide isomerase/thioredoxin
MPARGTRLSAAAGAGLLPALLAAGCLLLAGCPGSSPKAPAGKSGIPPSSSATGSRSSPSDRTKAEAGADRNPPGAAQVTLSAVDKAGYERFLQEHRGKVVLVDFWATWCPSCVELLPHNVALQKRFAGRGLVVATVSMDELDDPDDPEQQAPVRRVLAAKAATLQNLIVRPARPGQPGSEPFKAFAIPGGALPYLELYDRDGERVRTFQSQSQPIKPEAIDQAVEKLLGTASQSP